MIKKLLFFLALCSGLAAAQGGQRIGQATNNVGGYVKVVSGATISVCTYPSCGAAVLYQDVGLMVPLSNPFHADSNGNYDYYVAAGTYFEQVYSPGTGTFTRTVSVTTGGGSVDLASPPPIGNVTPNTGQFSSLTATGALVVGGTITAGSGMNVITTSTGKLDAAMLANGTGVAPYQALGMGGDGSGTHCLLDNGAFGSCMTGGTGITSLAFKNGGTPFGTMTTAGSLDCVGCAFSGADPNFTLTVAGVLPTQTAHGGSVLTTNGTTASWAAGLPLYTLHQPPFNLLANGSNEGAAWAAALSTLAGSGGGIVQLLAGDTLNTGTTVWHLPKNVMLSGTGISYSGLDVVQTPSSSITVGCTDPVACIYITADGHAGMSNLALFNTTTSTAFILQTKTTVNYDNVSFTGSAGSLTTNNAVNDAIVLGLNQGTCATDDNCYFIGLGTTGRIYTQQIRRALVMNARAQETKWDVFGSATDSNCSVDVDGTGCGPYIDILGYTAGGGSSGLAAQNYIYVIGEMGNPASSTNAGDRHFSSIIRADIAINNIAIVEADDAPTTFPSTAAYLMTANATHNYWTCMQYQTTRIPCYSEPGSSPQNQYTDMPGQNTFSHSVLATVVGGATTKGVTNYYLWNNANTHTFKIAGGSSVADYTYLVPTAGGNADFAVTATGTEVSGNCVQFTGTAGALADSGAPCGGGGSGTVTSSLIYQTAGFYANGTTVKGFSPLGGTYPAEMFSILANGSDQTANINAAAVTLTALGPGTRLQLPVGTTVASSGPLVLKGILLVGAGAPGWNQGSTANPTTILKTTFSGGSVPNIQCLDGVPCGLENLQVVNDANATPFMLYTCGVPNLHNVMFKGEKSIIGNTPDNDGIIFGTSGQTGSGCGTANRATDGFVGYGANQIDGLYFQNIRTALILHNNANDLHFNQLRGDYTDGFTTGYFIEVDAPSTTAEGDSFVVQMEQGPFGGGACNYVGALHLNHNADNAYAAISAADIGTCASAVHIESGSVGNTIFNQSAYYAGNTPVIDANAGHSNTVLDANNNKFSVGTVLATVLGGVTTKGITNIYVWNNANTHTFKIAGGSSAADYTYLVPTGGANSDFNVTATGTEVSGNCAKYTGTVGALTNAGVCIVGVTSPNSTLAIAGTTNLTIDVIGAAGKILAGATPALTFNPALGVDGTSAGTLTTANGSANAHTIWGSSATSNNQLNGPTAVIPDGELVDVSTSGTVATLRDSGIATANLPVVGSHGGIIVYHSGGPPAVYNFAGTSNVNYGNALISATTSLSSGDVVTIPCVGNSASGYYDIGSSVLSGFKNLSDVALISMCGNPYAAVIETSHTGSADADIVLGMLGTTNAYIRGITVYSTATGAYTLQIGAVDTGGGTHQFTNLRVVDSNFIGDTDNLFVACAACSGSFIHDNFTSKWDTTKIANSAGNFTFRDCTMTSTGDSSVGVDYARAFNTSPQGGIGGATVSTMVLTAFNTNVTINSTGSGNSLGVGLSGQVTANIEGGLWSIASSAGTALLATNATSGGHYGNFHVTANTKYSVGITGGTNDDSSSYYWNVLGVADAIAGNTIAPVLDTTTTATTQAARDASTKVATTAYVDRVTSLYNTPSTPGTSSITPTTMITTPADATNHVYRFIWAADITTIGTSCVGNTTLGVSIVYQDPSAASPQTVTAQAAAVIALGGNGTAGNTVVQGTYIVAAKPSTAIQYSTTYTAGGTCSPGPAYQIYPTVQLVN